MPEENKGKIYLAGSYNSNFRDKIINALPDHDFADPRKHRQFSIATIVVDDMAEAEECPILIANFPKGKPRGVMTYAEIGASRMDGHYIMVADENEQKDLFLQEIADEHFSSIDKIIDFIGSNNKTLKSRYEPVPKKEKMDKIETVFLASNPRNIPGIPVLKKDGFNVLTPETMTDLKEFKDVDLNVVYFPEMGNWERKAVFFMGAAYALRMPTLMIDEKKWSYPPLNGLARRIARCPEPVPDYWDKLGEKRTLETEIESRICYDLFAKYDGIDIEV